MVTTLVKVAAVPARLSAPLRGPHSACSVSARRPEGATRRRALRAKGLGDDLRAACAEEWRRGTTEHAFIAAVRDGSIAPEQYNAWLLQDYLFVQDFTRFAGAVLAKAPAEEGMLLLLDGSFAVLGDELRWFASTLAERGVEAAGAARQPANERYCDAMARWGRELDWGMAVLAFFAVESSYNAAWGSCGDAPEPYRGWAARWSCSEFTAFCGGLEAAAEAALADPATGSIPPERMAAAVALFREVLLLEEGFWSMAYEGGAP
mmetsp:Transcript_7438/g.19077  ORF Transcript_7438/g.19077 Transcript_7438/m.19077 type:complete len:263 (+) Transcript_7438:180-968(+)|eukprot:jgi/Tetstr1/447541/TSEL_034920.t1